MERKLYVYTKENSWSDPPLCSPLRTTWYETTKDISEGSGDVFTTQIAALAGAQGTFKEIYIDGQIIWPNEKQKITNKELRPAHNLARLVACWYRYVKEGDSL